MKRFWKSLANGMQQIGMFVQGRSLLVALLALAATLITVPNLTHPAYAAPVAVVNPDLSQVNIANQTPNCFEQSGWGDHTVKWSLVAGHNDNVAQSLQISNYQSGDRKLMIQENTTCAPAVTPGQTYDLSVWYKSTAAKNSLTVFRHSAAGWTYWTDLKALPAAAAWTQAKGTTPAIPAGTDQISFGISLSANGTLVTDDYNLVNPNAPVTQPSTELTTNPGLEQGGVTPTGWQLAGWGDSKVTNQIVAGHNSARAYSLTLTNRTQGDYKLIPADASAVAVQPGQTYNVSVWYKSTTASNSLTIFAHTASGWGYWTDIQTLPAAANWTQVSTKTPAIPAGIDAIAWGVSIYDNGTLVTDDYSTTSNGATTPPATGEAATGKWIVADYQLPIRAVHSTLLKNGKILLIAGSGNDLDQFNAGTFKASVFDPITGTFTTLNVPKDMFCAGHVTLPDGRVLIQGGTSAYPTDPAAANYGGIKDSFIFDPDTNTFTKINDANEGHWYPTLTEMGDGNIWMGGGLKADTTGAVNTEEFNTAAGQWMANPSYPQTWSFWGLYPAMHLMADGRLFYSGSHTFGNGLSGTGASIYNPNTGQIAAVNGLRDKDLRDQSASVLLPPAQDQKVMIAGGGNINGNTPGINLTDIIDLKAANPAYVAGPDLPGDGKMYLNSTILPDRTVLYSNGGKLNRNDSTNVMTAAIYDPTTNTMKSVPADPIGRNYHSSAVLLPDGRVVTLGSNPGNGTFEMRISIYQPAYLFRGARPTITNAPNQATYGQNFSFNVNAPNKVIKSAQLMRPMSVTHQMDSNMRLVDLPVTVQNGVATVSVTNNKNLLPPGPYMLTVTDSDGVPSVASWVMIK